MPVLLVFFLLMMSACAKPEMSENSSLRAPDWSGSFKSFDQGLCPDFRAFADHRDRNIQFIKDGLKHVVSPYGSFYQNAQGNLISLDGMVFKPEGCGLFLSIDGKEAGYWDEP